MANLCEVGDQVTVRGLRILCDECAEPVPADQLERLLTEPVIKIQCKACHNPITIMLSELDAFCDSLVEKVSLF